MSVLCVADHHCNCVDFVKSRLKMDFLSYSRIDNIMPITTKITYIQCSSKGAIENQRTIVVLSFLVVTINQISKGEKIHPWLVWIVIAK